MFQSIIFCLVFFTLNTFAAPINNSPKQLSCTVTIDGKTMTAFLEAFDESDFICQKATYSTYGFFSSKTYKVVLGKLTYEASIDSNGFAGSAPDNCKNAKLNDFSQLDVKLDIKTDDFGGKHFFIISEGGIHFVNHDGHSVASYPCEIVSVHF